MNRKVTISLLITFFFASCNKAPIPIDKMTNLMVDVQLMEAGNAVKFGMAKLPKEKWSADYQFVCKKHNVDTATFSKAINWYQSHPDKMSKVMDNVIAELQKIEINKRILKP